eukprot:4808290-Pyramimonas_sp.AAC.1
MIVVVLTMTMTMVMMFVMMTPNKERTHFEIKPVDMSEPGGVRASNIQKRLEIGGGIPAG